MLIVSIAVATAKPLESEDSYDEEHYEPVVYQPDANQSNDEIQSPQATYDEDYSEESRKTKRSLLGDDLESRKFFDTINKSVQREVRHAQGETPTIQLGDLLSAVEHTLVHSAQNLAIANATNATSFNSSETSTVIALPISFPTPSTAATLLDDVETATTVSDVDVVATTIQTPLADNDDDDVTIIQTINSTQISPADSDSVVRVQQQHITLFSAGAGIFPHLPSVNLDLLATLTATSPKTPSDCLEANSDSSSSSEESDEKKSSSPSTTSSNESSDESHEKPSVARKCVLKNASDSIASTITTSDPTILKKTDNLQEKIAEVEADPVILTQGI